MLTYESAKNEQEEKKRTALLSFNHTNERQCAKKMSSLMLNVLLI